MRYPSLLAMLISAAVAMGMCLLLACAHCKRPAREQARGTAVSPAAAPSPDPALIFHSPSDRELMPTPPVEPLARFNPALTRAGARQHAR